MMAMRIFFASFDSSWYKIKQKLFLGVSEVAKHEYDIGFGPRIIGAQDRMYAHLLQEFLFIFV